MLSITTESDDTQVFILAIMTTNKTMKYLLELGDGLRGSQDSLGRVSCHLGCLAVGSPTKELVELGHKQLVSSPQVVPHRHPEGQIGVVEGVLDVGDDGLLVHGDGEDLAPPVDPDDAIAGVVLGRHEDCVRADPVLVDQGAALYVVEVDIAVLGDQIDDAVLLRNLH